MLFDFKKDTFNFCSFLFDDHKNNIPVKTIFCDKIFGSWDKTAKCCQKNMLQYIQVIQHLKARWQTCLRVQLVLWQSIGPLSKPLCGPLGFPVELATYDLSKRWESINWWAKTMFSDICISNKYWNMYSEKYEITIKKTLCLNQLLSSVVITHFLPFW